MSIELVFFFGGFWTELFYFFTCYEIIETLFNMGHPSPTIPHFLEDYRFKLSLE